MRVSKNGHEEAAAVVVMKVFSRAVNSLLVACVLAAGASAYGVPEPQRDDRKGPPPKEEKVVPKEDKRPRNEERRNDDRREQREDKRKKGDG